MPDLLAGVGNQHSRAHQTWQRTDARCTVTCGGASSTELRRTIRTCLSLPAAEDCHDESVLLSRLPLNPAEKRCPSGSRRKERKPARHWPGKSERQPFRVRVSASRSNSQDCSRRAPTRFLWRARGSERLRQRSFRNTPINSAIFGWVFPFSCSNIICIRWRTTGSVSRCSFFLQALYLMTVALNHPISRIR
jgi:hypothetical protein